MKNEVKRSAPRPDQATTLVDLLCQQAQRAPERRAYTLLAEGETEAGYLSYGELDRQARAIGAWLQDRVAMGARALLLYPAGFEYVAAFLGCLYAGVVAVPAYPPHHRRGLPRLRAILADSQAEIALSTGKIRTMVERLDGHDQDFTRLQWLITDQLLQNPRDAWQRPPLDEQTLAFLQYTSGSTGTPKGVMVSHGNLIHNERMIQQAFEHTQHSTHVVWLPLYHDMGLIGNVLQSLYIGAQCILMSPAAFLQRPFCWLQAISQYRAHTSGAPNFAYELCVRRIPPEQRTLLDLRSWQVAFNGAEPVRAATLERFVEAFKSYGFRREAFHPCYGLAEATLIVSGGNRANPPLLYPVRGEALEHHQIVKAQSGEEGIQTLVSCGHTLLNQEIRIVDPETCLPCAGGRVGEIWVKGPSVTQGYFNRPQETGQVFQARLASTDRGPFLRTGDLGFLEDGELFVTGRLKDLLILRGRNLYPQDIERTVEESLPGLRAGGGAAFAVEVEEEERLVVVQEVEYRQAPDIGEAALAIRRAVAEEHEVQVYGVVLIKPGSLPKTSSGKVQRQACRALFLNRELECVGESLQGQLWEEAPFVAPRTPLEQTVATIWVEVLGLKRVGIHEHFFAVGGDSLRGAQVIARLREAFQVAVSLAELFQLPTVAELAEHIGGGRAARATLGVPLQPAARGGDLPLSSGQQRLWFLDQLETGSAVYNIPAAVRLTGQLDRLALEYSLNEIVRRHEALRTTFALVGGRSVQRIAPDLKLQVPVTNLSELSEESQEAAVRQLAAAEAQQPFDLTQGPLLRGRLIYVRDQVHVLLLTVHHIVADGWSIGILLRELETFYMAFCSKQPSPLVELPLQYADYAVWQQQWLQGQEREQQLSYWRQQLGGSAPVLTLPMDRPRPEIQSYRGETFCFKLSPVLSQALKDLSRQEEVTLFMLLVAAFQVLLCRYAGQDDIVIGTPVTGRSRPELEGLIGFFVNTLVLRVDLSGNPTFRELLRRVREICIGAYSHQDMPFEQIVDELQSTRDLGRNPLFQVMFALQDSTWQTLELPSLQVRRIATPRTTSMFDLTVKMIEGEEGLEGTIEYCTELFEQSTIERLQGHFEMILEGVVRELEARVRELPLLREVERTQIVRAWNATRVSYSSAESLAELFEAQVERTPEAVAVVYEGAQLTYQELNRRANQLAHHLRGCGVGPEVLVGVCMERSLELVIGLYGILKAGGAYVPLDPESPSERMQFIIEETQGRVFLTQARLRARLPQSEAVVICLDTEWPLIGQEQSESPESGIRAENLAYIIYTSGSTGRPKGVLNTQRGICNRLQWMQAVYQLTEADRVLQKTPFSFDVSVWEFFWPLLVGARLVVARPGGQREPEYLGQTIEEDGITTIHFVPSMLQLFVEAAEREQCQSLRRVICSGEALPYELQERFFGRVEAELYNLYGPTEAAVDVTCWTCQRRSDQRVIPIGRPIANTQIYLLDAQLQPVPVRVAGELYIGGIQVARGYLGRPELTAERFLPDLFDEGGGGRLYRTGDLARYLSDGDIEYLGRLDDQVKIRGFRIELGEITAVLAEHPGIQESVVVVRENARGEKRLAAYVVPSQGQLPATRELLGWLRGKLPEYMLPAAFVQLEALPLTPNGKVDRQALPAPDMGGQLAQTYVAPRTVTEEQLVEIWQDVLGVDRIGVQDNFFELGGDSILSIQMISRAKQTGLLLTPKQIFQHQTIAALALIAQHDRGVKAEQGVVSGVVPLTPIQRWFFSQALPNPHHWNQSILLEAVQPVEPLLVEAALGRLLSHHDALRVRFVWEEGSWQQTNLPEVAQPVLQLVDLSGVAEEEQEILLERAAAEWQARLQLTRGPLLRAVWFHLGEARLARLLITIHHLVVDGVSWRILLADLQTAYRQLEAGQPVTLPPKTTSFKQWAERLQAYGQSEAVRTEWSFWQQQIVPEDLGACPVDMPEGARTEAEAERVTVELSDELTRALLREVPAVYRTQVHEVLLAALAQTLLRWMERAAVCVSVEGHGREDLFEDLDVSRTVGWFTSVFPVVLRVEPDAPPGEVLKAVKEQMRQIPNRGFRAGLLRYGVAGSSIPYGLWDAQISFNYLGQLDQLCPAGGLFRLRPEFRGQEYDGQGEQPYEFDISAWVVEGRLWLCWKYSRARYRRATIEQLGRTYLAALQGLISHCQSPGAGGYTPSDFPLTTLDQATLDAVICRHGEIEDLYPLTPLQHGMLFHSLYAPRSGVYVEQLSCLLKGELQPMAFQQAWQAVIDQHPVLRTAFVWDGMGEPLQVVHRRAEVPFERQDWQRMSRQEQTAQWEAFLEADRQQGFDFGRPPVMRVALIQLAEDELRFVVSYHHVLFDGWSLPFVLQEVFQTYHAVRRGERALLPVRRPYRDYVAWLRCQDPKKAEAYWRAALIGFRTSTPLIVDKTAETETGQEEEYAEEVLRLTAAETVRLQAFAQQQQLTLSTILQAAWAFLLSRYSGEEDVVFGMTVSGRSAEVTQIEAMVGVFINTVPMRLRVPWEMKIQEWLVEVMKQNVEMGPYEHSPLVQIQGWSEIPPGQALFDSILVFENYPVDRSLREQMGSLGVSEICAKEQTNYPLTVTVKVDERLAIELSYSQRVFERETIVRTLGHWRVVVEKMVREPEARLSEVGILTASERVQIVETWNASQTPYPVKACLHELIEAQVRHTPDALAVSCQEHGWTYGELNARANQLARALVAQGVEMETVVAVLTERGNELLAVLLGILKAGGGYLPLDPRHPPQRLAQVLGLSQASVVVTTQASREQLARALAEMGAEPTPRIVVWEEVIAESAEQPNLPRRSSQGQVAYVIYTSGSTGVPKGVMVEQAGMLNNVWGKIPRLGLGAGDVIAQTASQCFDISIWQFLTALMCGGRVEIIPDEVAQEPACLMMALEARGVTVVEPVPAVLQRMVEAGGSLSQLRWVLPTGEGLAPELCRRWLDRYPQIPLLNAYGPAECADDVAFHEILEPPTEAEGGYMPIGRPADNLRVYVLGPEGEPAPVGVIGEIYIGGVGVGRGYIGDPERTAAAFAPDALSGDVGGRLYRTGDLGRYQAGGVIEFVGRRDQQVKVRGYRIELGEVEARLVEHPEVQEAAVRIWETQLGDPSLVAYVVLTLATTPTGEELRTFLRTWLPEYMVPAVVVELGTLPRTPNGKVDRQRLPAPDFQGRVTGEYVGPRTVTEELLAAIWVEVLGLDRVGIHDNFFELGGHSLVATQVMSRLRRVFRIELPLRVLFEVKTLSGLAGAIEEARLTGVTVQPPPIVPVARKAYRRKRQDLLGAIG